MSALAEQSSRRPVIFPICPEEKLSQAQPPDLVIPLPPLLLALFEHTSKITANVHATGLG